MSVESALRAAGAGARDAHREAHAAEVAMLEADITTSNRARFFIAQVMHESGGLYYREELASGVDYNGRRDLGNTQPGDGPRFKGRGWIQLTGRNNYRAAGKALGLPLESHPKLAATSEVAWRVAAWFWRTRGLNVLADRGDFLGVTRRINGGTNGLEDRKRRLRLISTIDARPRRDPWEGYSSVLMKLLRDYDRLAKHGESRELAEVKGKLTVLRKQLWRNAQTRKRGGDGNGWTALRKRKYASLRARTL